MNLIGKWKLVAYEHIKPSGETVRVTEAQEDLQHRVSHGL
jgi:hypothetical protein